jgi:hypothetical protein
MLVYAYAMLLAGRARERPINLHRGKGMRAHSRAYRRMFSLIVASAVGCGAAVGLGGTVALAAAGGPTGLTTAGRACASASPGPYLSPARLNDAQAVVLDGVYDDSAWGAGSTADFQVWDVTKPDQPQDWSNRAWATNGHVGVQLEDPSRQLDGVTYAWKVRVVNGSQTSPWSDTCYYTVDRSAGPAPAVSSTDYPAGDWDNAHGEIGAAGSFTFSAASDDIVSYKYTFNDSVDGGSSTGEQTVQATGGRATINWSPRTAGPTSVTVYAIDRAGNYSDQQYYSFYVRETRPYVFSAAYQNVAGYGDLKYNVGVPGEFDFTSSIANTTSFVWHIDQDGPSGTVDADASGKASVMIAPTKAGHQTLYVRNVAGDGLVHPEQAYQFYVDNGPAVTGDVDRGVNVGSSLTFHLAPRTSNVTSYVYWNVARDSSASAKTTIAAGADGSADLVWSADNTNEDTIGVNVQARSADGTLSEPRWLSMNVWGVSPTLTRTGGDVVGTTATITARTEMANPTQFEAVLNRDNTTKQIVPASADGTATFKFAVTKAQYTYVTVIARNAAGVHTDEGSTSWSVTDGPAVISTDFPASASGHIAPGTFTFKAQQAGATKFIYTIIGAENYQAEAPVGADGTARVSWTPPTSGYFYLQVISKTANGTSSTETHYNFFIAADPVTVTSVSPTMVTKGGPRTITVTGSGFNIGNIVYVYLSDGGYVNGTITGVSSDRRTLTATVDLTSAATGPAAVAVQPDGYNTAVTLNSAFTVVAQQARFKVLLPPMITGIAAVGSKLTSSTGVLNPKATAFTYQWAADGTPIAGATSSTYVIKATDLGKRLSVSVTAAKSGYNSPTTKSRGTLAVSKGPAPVATTLPTITGTARAGNTVQATAGTWKPAVDSYRYQWRLDGKLLGTTTATLQLTTARHGQKITVTVVAVRSGYADGLATSATVTVQR